MRRECSGCSDSHREIYYLRLTSLQNLSLYETLKNEWSDTASKGPNEFNQDFELYSTLQGALQRTNRWTHCDFNANKIGFPGGCAPTSELGGEAQPQWNSWSTLGQEHISFSLYMDAGDGVLVEHVGVPTSVSKASIDYGVGTISRVRSTAP